MAYLPGINGGRINASIGGNVSGAPAVMSSGTMVLAGGNNVTLSQANNTITISGGGGATLSKWDYPSDIFTSIGTIGQGSLSLLHVQQQPFNIVGQSMKIGGMLSAATVGGGANRTASLSLWMGIYTLTGSTLSLMSSGSANNSVTWNGSANGNSTSGNLASVQGMRQLTVSVPDAGGVRLPPGEYWVGALVSSSTVGQALSFCVYGNNQIAAAATGAVLTPIGSNTTAARDVVLFQGIYSAATGALPATIQGSQINNTSASNVMRANFYHGIYNAIY